MTPQELKASILQLAIQGKLVEQRPEEGTGEELFRQIQAEKQRRIKAGTIKKEKPLPEITEYEIPFDIPENWIWVRLNSLISLLSGADLTPDKYNALGKGIPYITGASNIEGNQLVINRWTEFPNNIAHKGDLLLTCKGTVGKTTILKEVQAHIARQLMAITPLIIDIEYLKVFIESQVEGLKSKAKSMIPGIERDNVLKLLIPLPPLTEQKRIVAKIEELLPLIDCYEQAWSRLENFNKRFLVDMQKSILQMAIQGKLVPQFAEEGTGEKLFQQIQSEKQALIKSGKIKKEKPLPEIAEDEIPFDIPESWKWVRLSQLFSVLNGDRGKNYPAKSTLSHEGIPFISALNLDGKSVIEDDNLLCLSEQQYEKLGNGKLIRDDIVVCIRGSLGKHGRYPFDKGAIASSLVILRAFTNDDILAEFLMMYLDTPLFFSEIRRYDNGTAQPNLAAKSLEQFLVPLPPLAEQNRIVAKLEEILPLCERLK